jgi:hypothetical protein
MSVIYGGDKITFSDGSTVGNGWSGFKNRIINGAMMIDQRNAGASVSVPSDGVYTIDRWQGQASASSKYTIERSTTAPSGFTNSLKVTSSSAHSLGSGDYFQVQQYIEGFNVADLGWGTADAQPVTLSFKVRSSLTGTCALFFINNDGTRIYPTSYVINSVDTWENKTITLIGDTTGTWTKDNSCGIRIAWVLGYGSSYSGATANAWTTPPNYTVSGHVNFLSVSGATFYITGVQLEKGSTATSFDYRPYGTELQLCQRYYQLQNGLLSISCENSVNSLVVCSFAYKTQMRATPSASQTGVIRIEVPYGVASTQSSINVSVDTGATNTGGSFVLNNFSSLTYARTYRQIGIGGADLASITLSAEL